MRVIAGKARHIQLKTIETMDTRPTTDRIKETLFNMLSNNIYEARFLDLFSGSGGIGIEALSRGASEAVMVENNPKAAMCISENLEKTKLKENGRVLVCDVLAAIDKLDGENKPFDYIFMDPPYNRELEREVLQKLKDTSLVDEYTTIIVEASLETGFDYLNELGYKLIKCKKYKTNVHMFIEILT
ncbi:MAG: 16S rRNA (guanine(966)-N(2))-methyltransferase RsmD [Lachnospiraceae bacterium]|nr:16S rRNA (guanine(966)-N(2))-methyltransferase RsmD [Lachnospiraceae bacterium]